MQIGSIGQRWKVAIVVLIAGVITVACVGFVYFSYTSMQSISQKWRYQDDQSFRQVSAASDLFRHLGYGGFIHNFKNYVLRQEPEYLREARSDLSRSRDSIRILHQTDLSEQERNALATITRTLETYRRQLDLAKEAVATGASIEITDINVQISDAEAIQAFDLLMSGIQNKNKQSRQAIDGAIGNMLTLLLSALIAIPVVLVAAFVSVNYIRRLVAVQGELAQKRELLQVMMDSIEEGITMVDRNLNFAFINKRFWEISGFPKDVVELGAPLARAFRYDAEHGIYGEGDIEEIVADRVAHASRNEPFEFIRTRPDGTSLEVRRHPIAGGGFVTTFTDITAKMNAEQILENAKAEAEAANAAKSQFLANMSHEIRTPMNAIIGLSSIAMKGDIDARTRDHLTKVNGAAKSLLGIINDILDFSKIEAGKLAIEKVSFQLTDVLNNVSALTGEAAARKNIELLFWTDADVPQALTGDPLRLGQIITNLVSNSVKFTESGEVVVRIKSRSREQNAIRLEISVSDTGIGIARENQGSLFSSFSQADSSTTRKFGGTGLGLAISRKLVELMDGSISVVSEPGQGSTFTFNVRLGLDVQRGNNLPKIDAVRAEKLSVLIADDNATARIVMRHAIEGLGFSRIDTVVDGEQAVKKFQKAIEDGEPYDILLFDWQMPVCDGTQAFRRIIAMCNGRELPATFLITGLGQEDLSEDDRTLPLTAFLTKPINTSIMIDAFTDYVTRGHRTEKLFENREEEPDRPAAELAGLRILVAEDNEINQQIAREVLEDAGIHVEIAGNGAIALELVAGASDRFDIVLMDIQMPEMDGYEATRQIRQMPACQDMPVIAMTAHAMAEERQRCFDAGMVDHVSKPIDPPTLYKTLTRWDPRDFDSRTSSSPPSEGKRPAARESVSDGQGIEPEPSAAKREELADSPHPASISLAAAREKVGLKEATFIRLIGDFQARYRNFPQDLEALLQAGNIDEARRLAHTLAGLAGTFAFDDLRTESKAVEEVLKNEPVHEAPHLDTLCAAHAAVFDMLDAELAPPKEPQPEDSTSEPAPRNSDEIEGILRKLDDHLASNRISARRLLPEIESTLAAAADPDYLELAEAVNGLNYSDGRKTLRRLAEKHGLKLPQ